MFFFSGIADEAGKDINTQIKAHKELGWNHIELRNIDGVQFTDVSDELFDEICGKLAAADMKVSCFASAIANWASKITDPEDKDIETLNRIIPRMKKLGTRFVRVMSWENDGMGEEEWRDAAVSRMKRLAKIAEEGGITLVIENCGGWASQSAENFGKFFELVGSPALKAVYDTGNPASHGHANTWDWYLAAKPHIVYVHIKNNTGPNEDGSEREHVWPEGGASKVLETLTDLAKSGYNGGISIEPHMKAVVHEGKQFTDADAAYATYVEYGKRTVALAEKACASA